nr:uncharacterized protein LOC111502997 [Leptinotarsa decemlineata]
MAKKAPGVDSITNKLLKRLPDNCVESLLQIINSSLALRYFPRRWKHAIVVMIPNQDIFVRRRFHVFHFLFMVIISGVLITQDIIRRQFKDIPTYTLAELLLSMSILERVNVLLLFEDILGDLLLELKRNNIISIQRLFRNYERLSNYVVEFTRLHSWYLLSLVTNTFLWIMYNVYKFIILHFFEFRKFPTTNFTMSFILSWTFTSLQIFHLAILIWAFGRVKKKQRDFKFHLSGFFCMLNPTDKLIHSDMIKTIYSKLLDDNQDRNAIVFNIDSPLLLHMVGNCVTNIMVLISFEVLY